MTGHDRDERIESWLREGPEIASNDFVESTLRPIPRMRQRSAWGMTLDRMGGRRVASVLGLAAVIVAFGAMTIGAWLIASSVPDTRAPEFELEVRAGSVVERHVPDSSAAINRCRRSEDGTWRYLYAGGEPHVVIDLILLPRVSQTGAADAAADLAIGPRYLQFDPAGLVSGELGLERGSASAQIVEANGVSRLTVVAQAPISSDPNGPPARVELRVDCTR